MIRLVTDTPGFLSDIGEVIRLFCGDVEIRPDEGDVIMTHRHICEGGKWIERWTQGDVSVTHEAMAVYGGLEEKRMLKRAVKTGCFLLMRRLTGETPPWGSLTGIRPTRVLYEALDRGLTPEEGQKWLCGEFFVSPGKAALLADILDVQRGLIGRGEKEFDLYIGIPFCTTRCSYCSFAAGEIGDGRLVEPYIRALLYEIRACAELMGEKGMRLRAGYVGGGTPTAIEAAQLEAVLSAAQEAFPGAREWTVEAGRPDTLSEEKLKSLKDLGIDRICVNPQSFSDETLKRIGRAHSAEDTVIAYKMARRAGFDDINMDVIAALPGETYGDFMRTMETIADLAPDGVTVHTLAIKRSSKLHEAGYVQADARTAGDMVESARGLLTKHGYRPYYLYRQKYMAGNLENVGYAKPGKACLYNIDNMEETAPVLALGAGAITKWLFPRELRIERAPNVRNIEQYIGRVEEMVRRKRDLIDS